MSQFPPSLPFCFAVFFPFRVFPFETFQRREVGRKGVTVSRLAEVTWHVMVVVGGHWQACHQFSSCCGHNLGLLGRKEQDALRGVGSHCCAFMQKPPHPLACLGQSGLQAEWTMQRGYRPTWLQIPTVAHCFSSSQAQFSDKWEGG